MMATELGENSSRQWLFLFRPVLFKLSKIPSKFYTLCTSVSSFVLPFNISEFNFSSTYVMIKP